MSSHCNRYPGCGCSSSVGTKCHLPEGDTRLLQKETEVQNTKAWEEFLQEDITAFDVLKPKKKKLYLKTGTKRQGRGSYYAK